jgi:hypothetical protein
MERLCSARRRERAEQLDGLVLGRDAELITQSGDAGPVLAAHQLSLMLQGEAPHEHPVGGLAAAVTIGRELAEVHSCRKLACITVDLRETLESLEIQLIQLVSLGQVPLASGVILEQRPAVELDSAPIGVDGALHLAGSVRQVGLGQD